VDPSAAGLIADMRFAGLAANGANNAVLDGIQLVKSLLAVQGDGRPRLTISPKCVNLIAEFESYCWKEGRAGLRDEPEKANDHAMDALRYALSGAIAEDTPPEGVYVYDDRVSISPY
jgi:phage terminase large subunit